MVVKVWQVSLWCLASLSKSVLRSKFLHALRTSCLEESDLSTELQRFTLLPLLGIHTVRKINVEPQF